ncbi:FG-GAP repeat domain-containing protein [Paenarthrobacter sp. NPDC090520]|uniref:FG-GAP repeat domain-containing protein n=1 Tax=Paenarthrobacter sp. NPDC090520 TaxID=3364382 RepID=UPI00382773F3
MTTTQAAGHRHRPVLLRALSALMGLALAGVVLASGHLVAAEPASAAEPQAPKLTWVQRLSAATVAPGAKVQLTFKLAERAQRVEFNYRDESRVTEHKVVWTGTPAAGPLTASATLTLPADVFHGSHTLQSVFVTYGDGEWRREVTYFRGSTDTYPFPVAWESLDFAVNNPTRMLAPNSAETPPSLTIGESSYTSPQYEVRYGTWAAPPSNYDYEWFRDGVRDNSGGFEVPRSVAGTGSGLTLKLTALAAGHLPETVETKPFYLVSASNPVVSGNPVVKGTVKASFDASTIKGLPAGAKPTFSYQWLLNNTEPIPGATGATYSPRPSDAGKPLGVAVIIRYAGSIVGLLTSPGSSIVVKYHSMLRDFDGDSRPDVLTRQPNGTLTLFSGGTYGTFTGGSKDVGWGWANFTALLSPGDFDSDGNMDVMARDKSGQLWLYRGNGKGGWLGSSVVGTGWAGFTEIIPASDFNGDGTSDVLARDTQGRLFLFPGNGRGGWLPSSQVGQGWNGFNRVFSPGDFSGDGVSDLLARGTDGSLHAYYPNGTGGWAGSRTVRGNYSSSLYMGGLGGFNTSDPYNYFFSVTDQGVFRTEQMGSELYNYYRLTQDPGSGWGYLTAVF